MSLGFEFHPEARAELFADVDWYDERESGLGERFEVAVRAAVDAAAGSPEASAWLLERTSGVRLSLQDC